MSGGFSVPTESESLNEVTIMSKTKFQGAPVQLEGEFIRLGAPAPDFELVKGDLSPLRILFVACFL